MLKKPEKFLGLEPEQHNGILIIDSGIGSLNLLSEVKKVLPLASVTAIADNAEFPYGQKSPQDIINRVCELADFFLPLTRASTMLVACNTASTVALPSLRKKLNIPVVGIVPAIKPASAYSQSGTIALLATPETAIGNYVDDLVNEHAGDCRVIKIGCKNLAELSEKKAAGIPVSISEVSDEILPLLKHGCYSEVDSVILGCTHFSFLAKEIKSILSPSIRIFDPTDAVARQVQKVHGLSVGNGGSNMVFTDYPSVRLDFNLCVDRLFYL